MRRAILGLLLLSGATAAGACDNPPLVAIPPKGELGDAVADVIVEMQRYVDAMAKYVDCLAQDFAAAGGEAASVTTKAVFVDRNNHAVAEAKAMADLFVERIGRIDNLRYAHFIDTEHESCIAVERIDTTAVVDDRAVLFYRRNGRGVYLNILEISCPDLESNRFFSYQTQSYDPLTGLAEAGAPAPRRVLDRVCNTDFIYSIEGRGDARRKTPCALGWFFPITDEQAALLREPRGLRSNIVVVPDGRSGPNAQGDEAAGRE